MCRQARIGNPIQGCKPGWRCGDRQSWSLHWDLEVDVLRFSRRQPKSRALIDIEHDVQGGAARLQTGVECPGVADPIEPRAVGNERRLMHMARYHDRWLV